MKKQKAVLTRTRPIGFKDGKFTSETESFDVIVMAIVDNYAMVRRKGFVPFVCRQRELNLIGDQKP